MLHSTRPETPVAPVPFYVRGVVGSTPCLERPETVECTYCRNDLKLLHSTSGVWFSRTFAITSRSFGVVSKGGYEC